MPRTVEEKLGSLQPVTIANRLGAFAPLWYFVVLCGTVRYCEVKTERPSLTGTEEIASALRAAERA
jgi:hypothetical protein